VFLGDTLEIYWLVLSAEGDK